jgi:predicted amidohydrolase
MCNRNALAARSGAKLVWFPTCDSAHEQKHVFTNDPNKKLPYWARIILQLKEEGIVTPVISILKDGKLTDETIEVIDIIAKHELILATGHVSHEEALALVKTAGERGVKRIIITHVDFPTTFYTADEQKELLKYGAVMEHCYTTWATGKVAFEETLSQIKAIGADRVILSTDLGQQGACYPDEGLAAFTEKLLNSGVSETDIKKMVVQNPAMLLA